MDVSIIIITTVIIIIISTIIIVIIVTYYCYIRGPWILRLTRGRRGVERGRSQPLDCWVGVLRSGRRA